jgi:lytic murein transglycosylase
MRLRELSLITVLVATLAVVQTRSPALASFSSCVAGLETAAVNAGVSRAVASRALRAVEPNESVLTFSKTQPEFQTPIWDYLAFLVDQQRIDDGRDMLRTHDRTLRAAEARFGVDRHVITAVWGVETDYGRERGTHFLPHALATHACVGTRRTAFWRGELIAALKLVDRGDIPLDKLYGSWAGAFGQTQFIPTTYQSRAIDFDGDGRRDLIDSIPDALGSTANYLKYAGWTRDGSWMIEVTVPRDYAGPTGRTNRAPLATWTRRGVVRADGARLSGDANAGLLLPAGPRGPGFLTFRNFDAIHAYNHADSYALAIAHLADRLAGHPPFRTRWPTDDPGLSRAERLELQKLLLARGFNVGEADGKIGPATRAAIAEAETSLNLPPTGRAGRKIYRALRGE